jgi:hypothetical protein
MVLPGTLLPVANFFDFFLSQLSLRPPTHHLEPPFVGQER